jgi:hypothetical protein
MADMDVQKFRVFNPALEGIPPLEVAVIDMITIHLKKLIGALTTPESVGLWLNPYRGVPWAPGLPKVDLVYLDEDHRVLQEPESFPRYDFKPFKVQPASALVLPAHTIFARQVRPGDKLEFRLPGVAERRPEFVSDAMPSFSVAHSMSVPALGARNEDLAPALTSHEGGHDIFASAIFADVDSSKADGARLGGLKTRLLRWLSRNRFDRRRANRYRLPGLVAIHHTSGAPNTYPIGNISETGLFLLTEERLSIGSTLWMKLQNADDSEASVVSHTKVVRWGPDGVGVEFVSQEPVPGGILKALAVAG